MHQVNEPSFVRQLNSNLDCFEWEAHGTLAEGHPLSCASIQCRLASYAHVVQSVKLSFRTQNI